MSERLGDMIEEARNGNGKEQPRHQTHPSDNKADRVFVSEGTRKMARGQDAGPADADEAMSADQVKDAWKNLKSRLGLVETGIAEINIRHQKGKGDKRSADRRSGLTLEKSAIIRQMAELRPKMKAVNAAESDYGQQAESLRSLVASAQRQEQLLMLIGQLLAQSLGLKEPSLAEKAGA